MKSIKDVNFFEKSVLLRSDLNEPVKDGQLLEDERIKEAAKTIEFLYQKQPSKLLILAHLGRPDGKVDPSLSLEPIRKELSQLLAAEVVLIKQIEDIGKIPDGKNEVYLLENIRFWKGEENILGRDGSDGQGDEFFAKNIAHFFDIYVNDAFSVSHRKNASVFVMPKFFKEKCVGFLFQQEYEQLSKIKDNPESPAVAIIGGAKIETKLPVIENLEKKYDKILIGGKVANEAIDQKTRLSEKVLLPVDFSPRSREDERLDIGPKTIEKFKAEIAAAKTIVWNGPMGKFEEDGCEKGTREIIRSIGSNQEAFKVVGGGETLEAIEKLGNYEGFSYVSMSGGAMLEFLAGKKLPGIEVLE